VWPILREYGYVIEEPDSDAEDHELFDEKMPHFEIEEVVEKSMPVISEKALLQSSEPGPEPVVVQLHVGGDEIEGERDVEAGGREEDGLMDQERSALGLILDGGSDDSIRGVGEPEAYVGPWGGGVAAEQDTNVPGEGDNLVYNIGTKDGSSEEVHEDEAYVNGNGKDAFERAQQ